MGVPLPNLGLEGDDPPGLLNWDIADRANRRRLDATVQLAVKSVTNTPPGSPADGDRHIAGTNPTGIWAGHANAVAVWNASTVGQPPHVPAWDFYPPKAGWRAYVEATGEVHAYHTTPAGWRAWEVLARASSLVWARTYTTPIPNPGALSPPTVTSGCSVDQDPTGPRIVHNFTGASQGVEQLERINQDPMSYVAVNHGQNRDAYYACPSYYQAIVMPLAGLGYGTTGGYIGIGVGQHLRDAGQAPVNEEHIGLRYSLADARWEFVVNSKTGPGGAQEFIVNLGTPAGIGVVAPTNITIGHSTVLEMLYYPGVGVEVALNHGKLRRLITDADMGGQDPFAEILANAYALNSALGGFGWYVFTGTGANSGEVGFYAPHAETYFIPQE